MTLTLQRATLSHSTSNQIPPLCICVFCAPICVFCAAEQLRSSVRSFRSSVSSFLSLLSVFHDIAFLEENFMQGFTEVGELTKDVLEIHTEMLELFFLCVLHDRFC